MISFHVSFLVGPVLAGAVTAAAGLRARHSDHGV
jgi:hypothetical protein